MSCHSIAIIRVMGEIIFLIIIVRAKASEDLLPVLNTGRNNLTE